MNKLLGLEITKADFILREVTKEHKVIGWHVGSALTIPSSEQDIFRINFKLSDDIILFKKKIHSVYAPGTVYEDALEWFHTVKQLTDVVFGGVGQENAPELANNIERPVLNNTLLVVWQVPKHSIVGRLWCEDLVLDMTFDRIPTPAQKATKAFAWAQPIGEEHEVKKFELPEPNRKSINLGSGL